MPMSPHYRPGGELPIGKVTGFKPQETPIVEVSLATTSRYGGGPDYEFDFPKVEMLKETTHRLNVAEAQAMERARMLGMKIVVDPKLRGSETEIHVSQERYDLLQQIIEEKKT